MFDWRSSTLGFASSQFLIVAIFHSWAKSLRSMLIDHLWKLMDNSRCALMLKLVKSSHPPQAYKHPKKMRGRETKFNQIRKLGTGQHNSLIHQLLPHIYTNQLNVRNSSLVKENFQVSCIYMHALLNDKIGYPQSLQIKILSGTCSRVCSGLYS